MRAQSRQDLHNNGQEQTGSIDFSEMDAMDLPPRSVVRKQREAEKKQKKIEAEEEEPKQETVQFPLVRLFLLLFFMLVITVITYPMWSEFFAG
ncbi:hypothetical protein JSY36_02890 [Bacillus sp. H-16]|uniref:hypothetical protein n=1 Tax=Alteribacter salitolerans TaxID=2912333 RepID=UPI0019623FE0|nr:hypothetical protein [Alteribacter salitolerans]MBM7094693.1 hypothetical protein [Alteribacter salitolerans]